MAKPLSGLEMKNYIKNFCADNGADMTGFASADSWDGSSIPTAFHPRHIFRQTESVIVSGMSMPLPVVETTPSALHKEVYETTNRQLDNLALKLTRRLNSMGFASFPFTRDTYTSMMALKENNMAAFAHIPAAVYAGLGRTGTNNCVLTPQFGPRVRFVSVFTEAKIPPDQMITEELCIQCGLCSACCPADAIKPVKGEVKGIFDKEGCLKIHLDLVKKRSFPCGICTKVCPVGEDRVLYKSIDSGEKYRKEKSTLGKNRGDPGYSSWEHIRKYGLSHKSDDKNSRE
jgi:epoxyqueuosine reductase QueG